MAIHHSLRGELGDLKKIFAIGRTEGMGQSNAKN